jgi:hypothetical protein
MIIAAMSAEAEAYDFMVLTLVMSAHANLTDARDWWK